MISIQIKIHSNTQQIILIKWKNCYPKSPIPYHHSTMIKHQKATFLKTIKMHNPPNKKHIPPNTIPHPQSKIHNPKSPIPNPQNQNSSHTNQYSQTKIQNS